MTNTNEFITDLDGGQFEAKLSQILSVVAGAAIDHNQAGNVSIDLKIKPIGNGSQVTVSHTLKFKRPTSMGSQQEDYTALTPMHVGEGGRMSYFPENQTQLFTKAGKVEEK